MKFHHDFSCGVTSCWKKSKITPDLMPFRLSSSLKRQIIMRIKLSILILFMAMLQVSASSFGQGITITEKRITLDKALRLIRGQSKYDFLFDAKVSPKTEIQNLNLKNASIDQALSQCLEGTGLTYRIEEHTILIKEKSIFTIVRDQITNQILANDISGSVITKDNEPLSGATVLIKRTKKAVYTNNHGFFMVKDVLPADTLVVSYIGYVTKNIAVGNLPMLIITLEVTNNALDAVVVQGYGKTTQRLTTGNIVRVTASDISKQLLTNPIMALQGTVPGLDISRQDGFDGTVQKVEIRGRQSINASFSSEPLYIIDGVPLTISSKINPNTARNTQAAINYGLDQHNLSATAGLSPLYSINPSDIESIEVLKDADATAIYGSRGGNGVILITTKKGKSGKASFTLNGNQGIKKLANTWDILNTEQFLDYRRLAFANDGLKPTAITAPELLKYDQNRYTDWQDYAWGHLGTWTNIDASFSGGDAQTNFRIGTSINRTKDITAAKGINQRIGTALNLGHKSTDNRFELNLSANYSVALNNTVGMSSTTLLPPNGPEVYDEKGALNFAAWDTDLNSFKALQGEIKNNSNLLNASLTLNYKILKNLIFDVNTGYNNTGSELRSTSPLSGINRIKNPETVSTVAVGNTRIQNIIVEPQFNYNIFIGRGKLESLVGGTYQINSTRTNYQLGSGFSSDTQLSSIGNAAKFSLSEAVRQYKYLGFFARINYNLENKYILNINARRDGSSRFGDANRFGNFGSVGAAWIASEESWVKNSLPKAISLIKFRGSYGVVGSDGIGDYQYLTQWGLGGDALSGLIPYEGVTAVIPQIQPNDDFHWQKNTKTEFALSLGFLNDRINFDAAWYANYSNNQLLSFPTGNYTGFSSLVLNSPAEVRNSGIELSLNASLSSAKDFSWDMGINYAKNKNILVDYPNIENSPYYANYKIGQSLNNTYAYKLTGVDPKTGEYTFFDANGDGKITSDYSVPAGTGVDDRIVAINTSPDFTGGMNHRFRFKNFGLSAYFNYAKQTAPTPASSGFNGNISTYLYENSWRNPGDVALFSKFTTVTKLSNSNFGSSDGNTMRADYLRLQALQLSYQLSGPALKTLGVRNLALNLTGQNLFVFTNYKGLDPEVSSLTTMPLSKTIVIGLNCTF
jgi:TonB-linked SusC/RagA family outer membrane protein